MTAPGLEPTRGIWDWLRGTVFYQGWPTSSCRKSSPAGIMTWCRRRRHDRMARLALLGTGVSPHLLKRMVDRSFSETDLRQMWDDASGFHANHEEGRWAIETQRDDRAWEIIVEPDEQEQILVVVTAYPIE